MGIISERAALAISVTIIQLITFGAGYTIGRFSRMYGEKIKKIEPLDKKNGNKKKNI